MLAPLRHVTRRRPLAGAVAACAVALLCAASATAGPLAQPRPEPPPALQCPTGDPICDYSERRLSLDGYRFQSMMLSGGADFSTQFWVRDAQGRVLLSIPPTRGNAYLAVQSAEEARGNPNPPVRLISFRYGPNDPAYAPAGLSSTVYNYDGGSGALVAGDAADLPTVPPENIRQMLTSEGWTLVFPVQ